MEANRHFLKGLDKLNDNQFEEAIELFTKAISEDDSNPFHYNHRAVAYLNIDKFDLSMFDMNKSIELDENYAYFYSCRGFLKAKLKDGPGAVEDYEKSLQLDPDNEITYNNLGLVLEQMGNMNRAKRMYKQSNDILGYDPDQRVLNADETHMEDSGITNNPIKKEESDTAKASDVTKKKEAFPEDRSKMLKERKKLAKEVFQKKSTFKEFLRFIGNGFKIKEDEETGKG